MLVTRIMTADDTSVEDADADSGDFDNSIRDADDDNSGNDGDEDRAG